MTETPRVLAARKAVLAAHEGLKMASKHWGQIDDPKILRSIIIPALDRAVGEVHRSVVELEYEAGYAPYKP